MSVRIVPGNSTVVRISVGIERGPRIGAHICSNAAKPRGKVSRSKPTGKIKTIGNGTPQRVGIVIRGQNPIPEITIIDQKRTRCPRPDHLASIEHEHPVARKHLKRIMGDENHANATPRKTRHQAPKLGAEGAINLRGHLIEYEIARLHCERRSQHEALELSARKR